MKKFKMKNSVISFVAACNFFLCLNASEKLFISDGINNSIDLGKENIFVSPGYSRNSYVAFSCERAKSIIIYNVNTKNVYKFNFQAGGLMDNSDNHLTFVTICWDQKKDGAFAAVYSKYGEKLVFFREVGGTKDLKNPNKIGEKAVSFNYRNGTMSYVDLSDGNVYNLSHGDSPEVYIKKPSYNNLLITGYKLSPGDGVPYFVLRNSSTNDCGIYKGNFETVVNNPNVDELYPYISNDGKLIGYIERDKKNGKSVICLKTPSMTIRSGKSFAMDENARLLEYDRMYFINKKLYFYIEAPDVFASITEKGLNSLSVDAPETVFKLNEISQPFIEKEKCTNLFDNLQYKYEYIIKDKFILKLIIPLHNPNLFLVVARLQTQIVDTTDITIIRGFNDNITFVNSSYFLGGK